MAEERNSQNKPIYEMFNEFCASYNFQLPILK
jgi:hypothetical protein